MIRIPSPVEGVIIERDLRNDVWQLSASGAQFRLRPWTWGDRRRILECATAAGQFDSDALLDALFDLLVDPQPELEDVSGLACACLHLLKADADIDLSHAEYLASSTFGWPPAELDRQPAAAVDRLLEQIPQDGASGLQHAASADRLLAPIPQTAESDLQGAANAGWRAGQNTQAATTTSEESGWTRIVFSQPDQQRRQALPARLDAFILKMEKAAGFSSSTLDHGHRMPRHPSAKPAAVTREQPKPAPDTEVEERMREPIREASKTGAEPASTKVHGSRADIPEPARERRRGWDPTLAFRLRNLAAPAEPAGRVSTIAERFPGTARLSPAAPRPASLAAENRSPTTAKTRTWGDSGGAVLVASAPASTGLDFPGTLVKVRWPESGTDPQGPPISAFDPQESADGFALSSLEEQMADVLERAVREAGIDLP